MTGPAAAKLWVNMPVGPQFTRCTFPENPDESCGQSKAFVRGGWLSITRVEPGSLGVDFSCVGVPKKLAKPSVDTFEVPFQLTNASTKGPLAGVHMKVCAMNDPECSEPYYQATTDDEGQVALTVPTGDFGFDGFVYAEKEGLVPPSLFHIIPPQAEGLAEAVTFPIATIALTQDIQNAFGAWLPTRGQVVVVARDCNFEFAAKRWVAVDRVDASSTPWYIKGTLALPLDIGTDESGIGGAFNIIPGLAIASTGAFGSPAAVARGRLWVRPGSISYIQLSPGDDPTDLSCVAPGAPAEVPFEATIEWRGQLVDYQSGAAVENATIQVCETVGTCSGQTSSSDEFGEFKVLLPTGDGGFTGHLRVDGPGVHPALVDFAQPVVWSSFVPERLRVLSTTDFILHTSVAGADIQADQGHIWSRSRDCIGKALGGATLKASSGAVFYQKNGLPLKGSSVTASDGVALAVNVAPGAAELQLSVGGETASEVTTWVEATRITYLTIPAGL